MKPAVNTNNLDRHNEIVDVESLLDASPAFWSVDELAELNLIELGLLSESMGCFIEDAMDSALCAIKTLQLITQLMEQHESFADYEDCFDCSEVEFCRCMSAIEETFFDA